MDSYIFIKGYDSLNGDVKRVNLKEPIPEELLNLPCFNTLGYFKNSINELKPSPYFGEKDGLFIRNILNNFPIKVINLDRRTDRWESSKKKLDEQHIENYERVSGVDGTTLEMNDFIRKLFRNNDFNYRQGFVGCALSHLKIWNELIRDEKNDYYIIMEDDFELVDDFKNKLNITLHQLIQKPYIDLHFLGYFYWKGKPEKNQEYPVIKNLENKSYMGGFYGYIISKSAAFKLINISKYYGIQNGIDRFAHINFDKMCVSYSEPHLVHSNYVVPGNNVDSDIQRNSNPVGSNISNDKSLTKVKVMTDWTSTPNLIKYLSKFTENNDKKWKNMIITDSNEADYYVIINKPRIGDYYKPEKTILFQMEPWVFDESKNWGVKTWGKWSKPEEMGLYKVLTHKYHPNLGEWHINKSYSELMSSSFKKNKTLSTFISEKNNDEGHIKRIQFMKYFEEKDSQIKESLISIDIYGRGNHGFKNYKGALEFKDEGLLPYKYTICVENNSEHNYITEKLYDGIVSECLCFYWGAPNVSDIIDERSIIKINLDNFEEAYNTIITSIQNNEWEKRLKFIKKEKVKILNKLQFMPSIYEALSISSIPVEKKDNTIEKFNPDRKNLTPIIHAGLGNQLFMIANAYALSKENNMNLVISDKYNDGNRGTYWNTLFKNIKTQSVNMNEYETCIDNIFDFHKVRVNNKTNTAIQGYFQSEKFFDKYKDDIKNLFKLPFDLENFSTQKIKSLNIEKEIVAVHIHRGDYVGSELHTVLPIEYYKQAMDIMKSKKENIEFVFFTDDKTWVNENFNNPIIVSCDKDYEEFSVMQKCHHYIIANSDFSWWASYLSNNKDKITIAPKQWFLGNKLNWKDIYCEDWIVI